MAAVDEIAIKLGIRTGDLKAALADANARIQTFARDGEKAGNRLGSAFTALGDKVGGLKAGFSTLAVALGVSMEKIGETIARAVTGVSKEQEDTLKRIAQLSDSNTETALKNMRATASEEVKYQLALKAREKALRAINDSTLGQVAAIEMVEDALLGQIAIQSTVIDETKRQLAIQELQQQVNAATAEIIAFETKKRTENAKAIDDAQKSELANSVALRDASREKMTLEERIASLMSEEAALKAVIAAADKTSTGYAADQARLLTVQNDLRESSVKLATAAADVAKKNADAESDALDKRIEVAREELPLAVQRDELLHNLAVVQRDIVSGLELEYDVTKQITKETEIKSQLADLEKRQRQANVELARLALIPQGQLTELQREQLRLLQGETTAGKQMVELVELLKTGYANLTEEGKRRLAVLAGVEPAEREVLTTLDSQGRVIGRLISEKERQILITNGVQLGAEKQITAELQRQLDIANARQIGVGNKGDVANLNANQLGEVIRNLNKTLTSLQATNFGSSRDTPEMQILRTQLFNAQKELDLRRDFNRVMEFWGSGKAEVRFAPKDFDRLNALRDPDLDRRNAQNLQSLATNFNNLMNDTKRTVVPPAVGPIR